MPSLPNLSTSNSSNSANRSLGSLAALPAEIRQQVFVAALSGTQVSLDLNRRPDQPKHPIFLVSRQVRAETRAVQYQGSLIRIRTPQELRDFLASSMMTQQPRLRTGELTARPRNLTIQLQQDDDLYQRTGHWFIYNDWAQAVRGFPLVAGSTFILDLTRLVKPLYRDDNGIQRLAFRGMQDAIKLLQRIAMRLWMQHKADVKLGYVGPQGICYIDHEALMSSLNPEQRLVKHPGFGLVASARGDRISVVRRFLGVGRRRLPQTPS